MVGLIHQTQKVKVHEGLSNQATLKNFNPIGPERHYIEPLSLTISEIAKDLGVSRKTISKIVNEKSAITPDMALRLAKAFNTSPELWRNMIFGRRSKNHPVWKK